MQKEEKNPKLPPPPESIGPYTILSRIGRGGMGDVFLAKDPTCDRKIVIKRARDDLVNYEIIRKRLLKEAKITASLCHPSIVPVYSIEETEKDIYYVMPYIEGSTLKEILKKTHEQYRETQQICHPIGGSINALLRIFQNICQAISYCHSMGILHRDLKPENILIGHFGQVILFDWGLASLAQETTSEPCLDNLPPEKTENANLTRPGKILGTLSYMPPERVSGEKATVYSDIYSLGVILYQMLTLKMPFHRTTVKEYKKKYPHEKLRDARIAAPNRDISPQLSTICEKCLAKKATERYRSVQELLRDLEKFLHGLPDWVYTTSLDITKSTDWGFQENILLSKLIPITGSTEIMQWYIMMISKQSFSGNKKLEISLSLKPDSKGIGFLFNVTKGPSQESLQDGYCVFIGSRNKPGITLYRSHVPIAEVSDQFIDQIEKTIVVEKHEQRVRIFVDDVLLIDYEDSLPIVGTHVGILSQDMEFDLSSFKIYVGSQNATVDCLAIPDAFLVSKHFDKALVEYEKIANSFSGRKQSRDAFFRLGITCIEQGKTLSKKEQKACFAKAYAYFSKLHKTPSEPLEYLGKSLIYYEEKDWAEEIKCLELGLRKWQDHALKTPLEERVLFRLHECSQKDRLGAYQFALLTVRYLPQKLSNRETHVLVHNLLMHTQPLYFLPKSKDCKTLQEYYRFITAQIAFWLNKASVIQELELEESNPLLKDIMQWSLVSLGKTLHSPPSLEKILSSTKKHTEQYGKSLIFWLERIVFDKPEEVIKSASKISVKKYSSFLHEEIQSLLCWAYLLQNNLEEAKKILHNFGPLTNKMESIFFFLKGCYLGAKEGFDASLSYFKNTQDFFYPPIYGIFAHTMKWAPTSFVRWENQAFFWEKIALLKQETLFYHCIKDPKKAKTALKKLKKTEFFAKM